MGRNLREIVILAAVMCATTVWADQLGAAPAGPQGPFRTAAAMPAAAIEASAAAHAFQDSAQAPMMIAVPAGAFMMGSPASEAGRTPYEDVQHRVVIARAFALGRSDVTFDQWDACVSGGGCNAYRPGDEGWGRGSQPVVNVSWDDARAYVTWLTATTGKPYRLPTEAEWEYAARGGTTTVYWWGNSASHDYANYGADTCCSGLAQGQDRWVNASPVNSFAANPFGLFDMNGEVMQLVADCWHESYTGAPADGAAWDKENCAMRTARGGAWNSPPAFIRSAARIWIPGTARTKFIGFRVARDM
jgi:formylglycine-generating enzyme required for sulfatase activity